MICRNLMAGQMGQKNNSSKRRVLIPSGTFMVLLHSGPFSGDSVWRDIVENKSYSIFFTFVHDAVIFLVVKLVGFANFKLIRSSVNHKPDPVIGGDGHMNSMTRVK